MEDKRISLGYPWVNLIEYLLDIASNIRTIEMKLISRIISNVIDGLLRELSHALEIKVGLISLKRLVKSISSFPKVYLIFPYSYRISAYNNRAWYPEKFPRMSNRMASDLHASRSMAFRYASRG